MPNTDSGKFYIIYEYVSLSSKDVMIWKDGYEYYKLREDSAKYRFRQILHYIEYISLSSKDVMIWKDGYEY